MATRDLTQHFNTLRSRSSTNKGAGYGGGSSRSDKASLTSGDTLNADSWDEARHMLPPLWVDNLDRVHEYIGEIKAKMEKLKKAHTDRLLVTFDSNEDQHDMQIDILTSDITDKFGKAHSNLKKVVTADTGKAVTADEQKVRKNVQRSVATQLQSLSTNFRKSQKEYLARVKAQKSGTPDFDFLGGGEDGDAGFSDEQMMELENAETVIEDRDQEIQQIAKSIEELATIFKELAVLVIDQVSSAAFLAIVLEMLTLLLQGTILDRIDYNMELVVERTKQGITELETAEKHQKSSRPLKCMLLLIFLIIIMLGVLIMKHSKSGSDNS
jgi:syntaxin 16